MTYSNSESAELIKKTVDYLKSQKISQQEIESRLNYTSLSKAKNYERYPQPVIEKKTRNELLEALLSEFSLIYNPATDRIERKGDVSVPPDLNDVQYYMMHYYAFARGVVDRALVKVINKRKVIMDYRIQEHWEGTYTVIENYTFIEVTKMGYTTPVKKLISLFSGTMKYGHDYLLGTYSTVKRDGFPAAGRIILERCADAKAAKTKLETASDYRIMAYLKDNVYITKLRTPNTLDEIVSTHHFHYLKLVGDYKFIYPADNGTMTAIDLSIEKDFSAQMEINQVIYTGYASFVNINTLNIRFTRKNQDSIAISKQILNLHINVRRPFEGYVYSCSSSSPIIHAEPSSFISYLILKKKYKPEVLQRLKPELLMAKRIASLG
ncbi:hypothetical protein FGF1_14280 [Flavobacteriaceae bacterium GF1]